MGTTLTTQERLKDLRKERDLTLDQLAELTGLSRAALGSYESDTPKDISLHAIITLAEAYGVTTDYLLGLAETQNPPNADLVDLRLGEGMIELLKSGRVNAPLLCEFATHKDFVKLLADIEVYVDGLAAAQIQNLNAWVDVARAEIMEKYQPGEHDSTAYLLKAMHIQEGEYFSQRIHDDIDGILADMKAAHADRAGSAPDTSVAAEFKEALDEAVNFKGSRLEQWIMLFCKQIKLRYNALTEEEKQWLTRIARKSELVKGHVSKRGKKQK